MNKPHNIQQVVVITGGSSGIGRATSLLFAAQGYRVFEFSRHGESRDGITHITCDITQQEAVQQAIAEVIAQTGRIDILINNAGFGIAGAVEFTSEEEARRQMDVNFYGAVHVTQAVLPYMRKQKAGRIIFTSSVAAVLAIPYQAFYSASKAAINALCLALRNEVAGFGIQVSAVMPGDVHTGFTAARTTSAVGEAVYAHQKQAVQTMERDEKTGMKAYFIAQQIYRVAQKKHPAPLYTLGVKYQFFYFLYRILPTRLVNWIVGQIYK